MADDDEHDIFGSNINKTTPKNELDDNLVNENQSSQISISEESKPILDTKTPTIDSFSQKNDKNKDEEDLEKEGGDTFDIKIKISDPIKIGDGMSAYMAYNVTTQTSMSIFKNKEMCVKRRFSDFLGLHERLNEKHLVLGRIVPPPPDKSVVGMVMVKSSKDDQSSTDFVERRQHELEKYMNRLARHSQLIEDQDFKEFLEADELPRAKNTSALSKGGLSRLAKGIGDAVSKITIKMVESDSWFEEKQNQIDVLDQQLIKLHTAAEVLVNLRKEVCLHTSAFAKSCSLLSNCEEHTTLSRALSQLAELEEKIEHVQQEQVLKDFYTLAETLKEYISLIGAVKAAFAQRIKVWSNWQSAQSTLTKKREALVKLELAGKSDKLGPAQDEVKEWEKRVEKGEDDFNAISKTVKVEMTRFDKMRVKDFKDLIITYLESLLNVQQQFAQLWEGFAQEAKAIC
ncbi:sorting nexin-2 isoform X2 [Hydra vulgaris]|uniref:Sorting nexin-2 isoform X2 n=1 Tax=Hydra vulgaris TaxID=6087 RepID=A0ABM4DAS4_HYDVU